MRFFRSKNPTIFQHAGQREYAGVQALLDGEEGLEGYSRDVVLKLAKGLKFDDATRAPGGLLEFGAGTGALAEIWRDHHKLHQFVSKLIQVSQRCFDLKVLSV